MGASDELRVVGEVAWVARSRACRAALRPTLGVLLAGSLLAACEGFPLPGFEEAPVPADYSNLDPQVADLPDNPPVADPPLPPRRPAAPADLQLSEAMAAPLASVQPMAEVDSLVGLGFGETETLLGRPTLQEVQPPAQIWSYNGPDCVLTIFFYPQVGGEQYRALAYDVTDAAPDARSAQRCFTALVAQNRGPGPASQAPPDDTEGAEAPAPGSGGVSEADEESRVTTAASRRG